MDTPWPFFHFFFFHLQKHLLCSLVETAAFNAPEAFHRKKNLILQIELKTATQVLSREPLQLDPSIDKLAANSVQEANAKQEQIAFGIDEYL